MAKELTVKNQSQSQEQHETTRPGRTFVPNVDIREADDALWIWADLPGVDETSVDVQLQNGQLSIEGRVDASSYAQTTPLYTEYNVGNFVRSFRIGDQVDSEQIQARMSNGVLELKLPKAAHARPRQIPISVQ